MIGKRVAHYEVTGKLGEGGMGEVYRASDPKLNREVALKVLPAAFSQDAERMARFSREAHVLAALNHPNIAAIYGLEEAGQQPALVMELVEGETLAERIEHGAVPVEEALGLALQIIAALEEAHDQGIVHRDLKPANIKITPKGAVKVLDFGLAKALQEDRAISGSGTAALTQSPTLTAQTTSAGMLLGTAAYMSPEQARGSVADRRADIWAFGVVLMEMLSGRSVYAGKTVSDTLAGVLAREPEWEHLPQDLPPIVRRLLERCLEKEIRARLQAIGEARILIEGYLADPAAGEVAAESLPVATVSRGPRVVAAVAAVVAVAAIAVAMVAWMAPAPEADVMRVSLDSPAAGNVFTPIGSSVVLSPDGRKMAYVAMQDNSRALYVRSLDQLQATLVSGTEEAYLPFFSPDSEWLAFVTPTELKKVSVSGGTPLTLAATNFCRGGTWSPDGTIIFTPDETSGLMRLPAAGGEPEALTILDEATEETTHRWPTVLPGGKALLFVSHTSNNNFDGATIEALDLASGKRQVLIQGGTYPRYAASGHLVYVREGTLYAVPFDAATLQVRGSPGPVIEGIMTSEELYGSAHYTLSESGSALYLTGEPGTTARNIVWVDRDGETAPLLEDEGNFSQPAVSPDGSQVAIRVTDESGKGDIWVRDLEREVSTRLTFHREDDSAPIWSPDGEHIVFSSMREGQYDLFRVRADGSGEAEPLTRSENPQYASSFSPDGRHLVYSEQTSSTPVDFDIFVMPTDGDGQPEPFLATPFIEVNAAFSPDGKWLAYYSNESGTPEVYVRPFPAGRGEWKISDGFGVYPSWSADGDEIYYRTGDGIAAVDVNTTGPSFTAEKPRVLFEDDFVFLFPGRDYAAAPGGDRFVLFQASDLTARGDNDLILVTNWFAELRRTFVER